MSGDGARVEAEQVRMREHVRTSVSLWDNDGDVRGRPESVWQQLNAEADYIATDLWARGYRIQQAAQTVVVTAEHADAAWKHALTSYPSDQVARAFLSGLGIEVTS